jgi:hypothetical protein
MWFNSYKVADRYLRNKNLLKEEFKIMKDTIKEIKTTNRKKLEISYRDPSINNLRFCYTRFADDFIIIGNFNESLAKIIKEDIRDWLKIKRNAILSEKKTIITNIKKEPARFLGFEIKATSHRKLKYVRYKNINKTVLQRTAVLFGKLI